MSPYMSGPFSLFTEIPKPESRVTPGEHCVNIGILALVLLLFHDSDIKIS